MAKKYKPIFKTGPDQIIQDLTTPPKRRKQKAGAARGSAKMLDLELDTYNHGTDSNGKPYRVKGKKFTPTQTKTEPVKGAVKGGVLTTVEMERFQEWICPKGTRYCEKLS